MTKTKTTETKPARKRPVRLAPCDLVPVAEPTVKDGLFCVQVRTGSQREYMTPTAAYGRAAQLKAAADSIESVAYRVRAILNDSGDNGTPAEAPSE